MGPSLLHNNGSELWAPLFKVVYNTAVMGLKGFRTGRPYQGTIVSTLDINGGSVPHVFLYHDTRPWGRALPLRSGVEANGLT